MGQRLVESIKYIIESGIYNKDELLNKIETLKNAGRLTAQEVDTLQSIMKGK